jgi:hypothetical protein
MDHPTHRRVISCWPRRSENSLTHAGAVEVLCKLIDLGALTTCTTGLELDEAHVRDANTSVERCLQQRPLRPRVHAAAFAAAWPTPSRQALL